MKRLLLLALLAGGCGPLDRPMPPRLNPEDQKTVDSAWDAALGPVGKYDRQRWLDALIGTQAYQAGVDALTFRSEKSFAGGRVVMEVIFDRAKPEEDRFSLTVIDKAGNVVRQEKFSREEVEQTSRDLFDPKWNAPPRADDPPEVAQQRAARDARWKHVHEMLPKPKEAGK